MMEERSTGLGFWNNGLSTACCSLLCNVRKSKHSFGVLFFAVPFN